MGVFVGVGVLVGFGVGDFVGEGVGVSYAISNHQSLLLAVRIPDLDHPGGFTHLYPEGKPESVQDTLSPSFIKVLPELLYAAPVSLQCQEGILLTPPFTHVIESDSAR